MTHPAPNSEREMLGSSLRDTHRATDDPWAVLEGLAKAATPGPWRWEVSLSSKNVALCGGPPKSGFGKFDHDVMTFRRWGMNGAAPVFWSWSGHLGTPRRADETAVPVEGREHHASWFRTIDDPNAAFIAAANPATVLKLIEAARASAVGILRQQNEPKDQPTEVQALRSVAWLRDVHNGEGDECLMVCAPGDPGSFEVYLSASEEGA